MSLAHEGLDSQRRQEAPDLDADLLRRAYDRCEQVTRQHSKTFHLAASLLPRSKRRAVHALYAFCRVSDDLVDREAGNRERALSDWRRLVTLPAPPAESSVALAWADARARYDIPTRYVEQLLDGVALDLSPARYATFDDLAAYCYGVASTVGLMAMHITGFAGADAVPYAVKLGVALQLTNILRDVGEDWRMGRLYLPQDELAHFDLSEEDLADGRVDSRWERFLSFQIRRNRRLYAEALPGIDLLHGDGRFAIAAAAELYQAILGDIEQHGCDVFGRRAAITRRQKLLRLPGIWWRSTARRYAHAWAAQENAWDAQENAWDAQENAWDAQQNAWDAQQNAWDAQQNAWDAQQNAASSRGSERH